MTKIFLLSLVIVVWLVVAAHAGVFNVLEEAVGAINPIAGLVVGTIGGLLGGKKIKDKAPLPNDLIPATNATVLGGTIGAITQDPVTTLATMIGTVLANWLHQAYKKITEKK